MTDQVKPPYDDDQLVATLKDRAVRLLVRREHSAFELRRKLRKSAPEPVVNRVLDELREEGAQSDQRFAEMVCRTRVRNGRGPVRLRYELNEHRISAEIIEASMMVYEDEWCARARDARVRKFGSEPPADYREWARQARFLQQRGFTAEQIGRFTRYE